MDERLERALGRAWQGDRPWDVLTRLTELDDRLGGHSGEARAADIVAEELRATGLETVTCESFDVTRWHRGAAALEVSVPRTDRDRSFEVVAFPYCPADEVTGALVDVGHGTAAEIAQAELDGQIAVASTTSPPDQRRHLHRMEKIGHAADAGAAAFVFANHVPGQLPPTGAIGVEADAPLLGVGVSHETGEWLREYAERGVRAHLRVESDLEPATSQNVVGTLGPQSDEEVLVVAHLDAHDVAEGALDNGCGVAVLIGLVRMLADVNLDARVRVAAVGCEEIGLLGSEALADALDLDRVSAVVNLDGAGRYRDLKALTHTAESMRGVVEGVTDTVGHPVTVEERPHPYSDHWPFLRRGVPALQLHSDDPDASGRWERGWTHTRADTRDKVDPRNLRTHAMLAALIVRELAGRDLPRIDVADLEATLVEMGADRSMRAAGVWPDAW